MARLRARAAEDHGCCFPAEAGVFLGIDKRGAERLLGRRTGFDELPDPDEDFETILDDDEILDPDEIELEETERGERES